MEKKNYKKPEFIEVEMRRATVLSGSGCCDGEVKDSEVIGG